MAGLGKRSRLHPAHSHLASGHHPKAAHSECIISDPPVFRDPLQLGKPEPEREVTVGEAQWCLVLILACSSASRSVLSP